MCTEYEYFLSVKNDVEYFKYNNRVTGSDHQDWFKEYKEHIDVDIVTLKDLKLITEIIVDVQNAYWNDSQTINEDHVIKSVLLNIGGEVKEYTEENLNISPYNSDIQFNIDFGDIIPVPDDNTAVRHDKGKLRYDLLPADVLEEVVKVLTFAISTGKYSDRNWEKGLNYGRVFGAANRHLWRDWYLNHHTTDGESGNHPLAHAICDIMMLLAYELRGMKEFDDRPKLRKKEEMSSEQH